VDTMTGVPFCSAPTNTPPRVVSLTVPSTVDLAVTPWVYALIEAQDDTSVRYVTFSLQFPFGHGSSGMSVLATLLRAAEPGVAAEKHGIWEANITLTGFGNTPTGNASIQLFIGDTNGHDVSYDAAQLEALGLKAHIFVFDSSRIPPTTDNCGGRRCGTGDQCCGDEILGPICYSPTTHRCIASKRLCGLHDSLCGTACFNPETHTCFGSLLCGRGTQLCQNSDQYACYNPATYMCDNGKLKLKPAVIMCGETMCTGNQLCCGNKTCYDPLRETCCSVLSGVDNAGKCQIDTNAGSAFRCCSSLFSNAPVSCYDPLQNFCCITSSPGGSSSTLCPITQTTFECCGSRGFRVPV